MRFSIVTPVYNAERHLKEMLESVRRQSFPDWELRIVDDGSTDGSRRIIRRYAKADGRIKPLFLENNSGSCFIPRRKAMESSLGEYVVNIDADDTVDFDYLEMLDAKISETGADIAYADMSVEGEKYISHPAFAYETLHKGKNLFKDTLDGWKVSGVGAVRRLLACRSLELYDREFGTGQEVHRGFDDENLTRLDVLLADTVALAQTTYRYRATNGSITRSLSIKSFYLLDADMRMIGFITRNFGTESEEYTRAQRQLFHHTVEAMRLLGSYPALREGEHIVRHAYSEIDFKAVRNVVSPRYFMVMRSGYQTAKFFLGVYGRSKG